MLGQFLGFANATVVITAIPVILTEVGGTPAAGTWMIAGAMLGNAIASPVWGRLADRFSPVALLTAVHVGVLVTAVITGMAQTALQIILARAVQGLFLGGLFSLTIIVLANIVAPRERGPYMGWLSAVNLVGSLAAPLIGGLIVVSPLGWRGTVLVAVPFCIACLVLLRLGVRLEQYSTERRRLDVLGGLLFAGTVSSFLVWMTFVGKSFDLASWPTAALVGASVLCLAALVLVELRAQAPIIPVRLLGRRVIALSAIATAVTAAAGIPIAVLMSMYFQIGRGLSPVVAGLLVVAAAGGTALSAWLVGRLSARTGRLRRYMIVGAGILALGMLLVAVSPPDAPLWYIAAALFVAGFGQGAVGQFTVLAAQNSVGLRDIGVVSGFMAFLAPLGGSTALTVTTAVFGALLVGLQAAGLSEAEAYAQGMPDVFFLLAGLALLALLAVALLPGISLRRSLDLEEPVPDEPR